jgi:putative SOS response-associated peptidase YedK
MCGRFTLRTPAPRLIEIFQVDAIPQLSPRFNIAPTQLILCIRAKVEVEVSEREALMMRWGLIPFWAKDASIGNRLINARSETVAEKPSFRNAYRKRRCLIMADGFYEWQKLSDRTKRPHLIHLPEHQPFAIAGLWESWTDKSSDTDPGIESNDITTCTLLTTTANSEMRELHDRMPVILRPEDWAAWLSETSGSQQRDGLLQPLPDGSLQHFPVSTTVNRPANDSPDCVKPL